MKGRIHRLIIQVILIAGIYNKVEAQQRAQYSQYMNNPYVMNPAAGGTEDFLDIKASYRKQWLGFVGAPESYYLTAHAPIGKYAGKPHPRNRVRNFHSIGGNIYNDVTGPTSRSGIYGSYAYNMNLTRGLRLAMGVFVGVQQYRLDGTKLIFHDEGDFTGVISKIVPDASVGTWLYNDHFFIGISTAQVLQSRLNFTVPAENNLSPKSFSKLNNHYFITGGYRIKLNEEWSLIPSVLLKVVTPVPLSLDINAKVRYKDLFWFGSSYRNLDSFIGLIGVTINNMIDIGYSYDATVSNIRNYSSGSHEILVGVKLKSPKGVQCPSNFW